MSKRWTKNEIKTLKEAEKGKSTKEISKNINRTKSAIRAKASREGISLNPKDKK